MSRLWRLLYHWTRPARHMPVATSWSYQSSRNVRNGVVPAPPGLPPPGLTRCKGGFPLRFYTAFSAVSRREHLSTPRKHGNRDRLPLNSYPQAPLTTGSGGRSLAVGHCRRGPPAGPGSGHICRAAPRQALEGPGNTQGDNPELQATLVGHSVDSPLGRASRAR